MRILSRTVTFLQTLVPLAGASRGQTAVRFTFQEALTTCRDF